MKKLKPPLAVVFTITSYTSSKAQSNSNPEISSANLVTMNGYTFIEADTMVRSFIKDPTAYDARTSFWFSKDYVNRVHTILDDKNEDLDGFRIYFGKHSGKNTIVMVATRETRTLHPAHPGSAGLSKYTHKDVFNFRSTYFNQITDEVRGSIECKAIGARLFGDPGAECTNVTCSSVANAISCEEARDWVQKVTPLRPMNSTSVWYPKSFFEYWKRELQAATDGDGIRIYLAEKVVDGQPRTTCVITTTRIKDRQDGTDYFECYTAKAKLGDPLDNGEECPNCCHDVTWPDGK